MCHVNLVIISWVDQLDSQLRFVHFQQNCKTGVPLVSCSATSWDHLVLQQVRALYNLICSIINLKSRLKIHPGHTYCFITDLTFLANPILCTIPPPMNKALPNTNKTLVDDKLLMHLLATSPVSHSIWWQWHWLMPTLKSLGAHASSWLLSTAATRAAPLPDPSVESIRSNLYSTWPVVPSS